MFDIFLVILEVIGTIAFAVAGAMTALKKKLDVLGVVILGVTTACGGGLLRDVLLNKPLANFFDDPTYVIISAVSSLVLFIIFYIIKDRSVADKKWYKNLLTITDAIGLGIFVVIGANETYNIGYDSFFIVTFMATITAVGGGAIRDIMVLKIPNIFCKHIYAVASIAGAILYFVFEYFGATRYLSIPIVVTVIIVIRMLAYHFELSLPKVIFKNDQNLWYFF